MQDYADRPSVHRARYRKARRIAAWCWTNGITPTHLAALTGRQWNTLARRACRYTASPSTQRLVVCLLEIQTAWAAGWPGHPRARRTIRTLAQVTHDLDTRRPRR